MWYLDALVVEGELDVAGRRLARELVGVLTGGDRELVGARGAGRELTSPVRVAAASAVTISARDRRDDEVEWSQRWSFRSGRDSGSGRDKLGHSTRRDNAMYRGSMKF